MGTMAVEEADTDSEGALEAAHCKENEMIEIFVFQTMRPQLPAPTSSCPETQPLCEVWCVCARLRERFCMGGGWCSTNACRLSRIQLRLTPDPNRGSPVSSPRERAALADASCGPLPRYDPITKSPTKRRHKMTCDQGIGATSKVTRLLPVTHGARHLQVPVTTRVMVLSLPEVFTGAV